jgi:hypothetical protein
MDASAPRPLWRRYARKDHIEDGVTHDNVLLANLRSGGQIELAPSFL